MTTQHISTINVHLPDPPTVARLTNDDSQFFIIHVGAVAVFFHTDAELQLWVSTLVTRMHTVLADDDPT
jgi:hypothetical protein